MAHGDDGRFVVRVGRRALVGSTVAWLALMVFFVWGYSRGFRDGLPPLLPEVRSRLPFWEAWLADHWALVGGLWAVAWVGFYVWGLLGALYGPARLVIEPEGLRLPNRPRIPWSDVAAVRALPWKGKRHLVLKLMGEARRHAGRSEKWLTPVDWGYRVRRQAGLAEDEFVVAWFNLDQPVDSAVAAAAAFVATPEARSSSGADRG